MDDNQGDPERIDPDEEYYIAAERAERMASVLCWMAAVSFSVYVAFHNSDHTTGTIAKIFFVVFTTTALVLGYCQKFVLLPYCDRRRRLLLISDSLGIKLSEKPQTGYYTNLLPTSMRRFVLSLAENTFFYPRLLAHEMPGLIALASILVFALAASIRFGTAELIELFAVVLLFSEVAMGRLIRLLWAKQQFNILYDDCCTILRCWPSTQKRQYVELLRLFSEYESIKARSSIRASTRTFRELNPKLTAQWKVIRERIESDIEHEAGEEESRKAEELARRS